MRLPTAVVLTSALALAAAAPAAAQDPLLSGYAGPGGGDQAVLGGKLIPAGGGSGSLRAPRGVGTAGTSAPAQLAGGDAASVEQDAGAIAAAGGTGASGGGSGSGEAGSGSTDSSASSGRGAGVPTAVSVPQGPALSPATYPTRRSDPGPLPLGSSAVGLALLGGLLLAGVAFATARLVRSPAARA